jgi:serine/threonine protein phosphatase PrpC
MSAVQSPSLELVVSACTAQDRGDRAEQQDRVAILTSRYAPRCALGVLADGMGGMSGGAMAAENVVLTSERCFGEFTPSRETGREFLQALVDEVHTVLRLSAITAGLEPHSTFAAVLMQPTRVDWCHVGDSRIYHIRDRKLLHCTSDHTFAQQLIEQGRMQPERARLHPSAHRLVNALGSDRHPKPTMGGFDHPRAGDTFLLCSDGLWNYFHAGEIVLVIEQMGVREAAATLIARARERAHGRGDNCSLVLLRFAESNAHASPTATGPMQAHRTDRQITSAQTT